MLTVEDLIVQLGQSPILQGVDLQIKEGEIVGLIGQNGCGKTTFLNALSGYVKPMAGSVLFDGEDVTGFAPEKRATLGMARSFQTPGVFREMTVEENLLIALERVHHYPWWWQFSKKWRKKADAEVMRLLATVNLQDHKHSYAGVLSGGQLRLLELLRLEICGGRLFLIDEPTAGVAPAMKKVLMQSLKELARGEGRSLLIVEHDLKFLFELVDRVVVFVEGRVYMEGTPEEVVKDPRLQEVYFGTK